MRFHLSRTCPDKAPEEVDRMLSGLDSAGDVVVLHPYFGTDRRIRHPFA